jgi:hypothetical protein
MEMWSVPRSGRLNRRNNRQLDSRVGLDIPEMRKISYNCWENKRFSSVIRTIAKALQWLSYPSSWKLQSQEYSIINNEVQIKPPELKCASKFCQQFLVLIKPTRFVVLTAYFAPPPPAPPATDNPTPPVRRLSSLQNGTCALYEYVLPAWTANKSSFHLQNTFVGFRLFSQ